MGERRGGGVMMDWGAGVVRWFKDMWKVGEGGRRWEDGSMFLYPQSKCYIYLILIAVAVWVVI